MREKCKNCEIELEFSNEKKCENCGFPHFGDEKELAVFYARETILESEIETAKKSIKFSKIALFLAFILVSIPLIYFNKTGQTELFMVQAIIAGALLGCFVLSFFKPILASLIGFSVLFLLYLSQLTDMALLWSGFTFKVASLTFLGISVYKILDVRKQLKRNPEIARKLNIKL